MEDSFQDRHFNQILADGASAEDVRCGSVAGAYPTIDSGTDGSRADVERNFQIQRNFSGGGPAVNSEFYTTWFTMWGEKEFCKQVNDKFYIKII